MVNAVSPVAGARPTGPASTDPAAVAQKIVADHTRGARRDLSEIRRDVDAVIARDATLGAAVEREVRALLTEVEKGQFASASYSVRAPDGSGITFAASAPSVADYRAMRAGTEGRRLYDRLDRIWGDGRFATDDTPAIEAGLRDLRASGLTLEQYAAMRAQGALPPAAPPAVGPSTATLVADLTQLGLDLAGVVDPTGAADAANAVFSLGRAALAALGGDGRGALGHLGNGVLSAVSVLPLGDLAKAGKIGKWAQTVADATAAVAANPALRATLEPVLRKIADLVGRIPQSAVDALPQGARESLERMKGQLDEFFGVSARNAPPPARMSQEAFDALPSISGPGSHVKPGGATWAQAPNFDNWTARGGKIVANADGTVTFIRRDLVQVRYSRDGWPDFSQHLNHPSGIRSVEITQAGNATDFTAANRAAGHPEWGSHPPAGYTWHHVENGTTMQLVPRSVHDKTIGGFAHRGGASVVNNGN